MLLVPCPTCGPRNATDLTYHGESHSRPDPVTTSRQEWREFLYLRDNVAGWQHETWFCAAGCRRWFQLERNTVTNEFRRPPMSARSPGDEQ